MNPADPRLAALARRAVSLFPDSVAVGASPPVDPTTLHPDERAGIIAAIPRRQAEFAGGRAAARAAQIRLRGHALPVPMGPDRAPVWPSDLRGSITHADGLCLAVVTDDPAIRGLGLDLEPDAPLPPEIRAEVLGGGESPGLSGHDARAVFSAKEAVFKALYPQVGHVFGFDAVQVALHADGFSAVLRIPLGPLLAGTGLSGRIWRGEGLLLSAITV